MKISNINKKIFKTVFYKTNLLYQTLVDDLRYLLLGIPSNEENRIIQYLKSRNANRYLSAYSNNRIKTVVVQIGMDKTASSSIQEFLSQNQQLLYTYSIEYRTDWGSNNHSIPIKSIVSENPKKIYQHIIMNLDKNQILTYNQKNLLSLCRGISESRQETYVFFGEGICSLTVNEYMRLKNLLSTLMPHADIKIFHCVRSNIGYASSAYQQAIKMGRYHDNLPYMYSKLYRNRIKNAMQVFGRERLFIYAFEKTLLHPYGPVGYFLEKIGVSTDSLKPQDNLRVNESISSHALEIMEYINKKHPLVNGNTKNPLRSSNDCTPIMGISGPKYRIPDEVAVELLKNSRNDILWLKENFDVNYPLSHHGKESIQLSYDLIYYNEAIEAFNNLNTFLKQQFLDYVIWKRKNLYQKKEIHIFDKLQGYMAEKLNESEQESVTSFEVKNV